MKILQYIIALAVFSTSMGLFYSSVRKSYRSVSRDSRGELICGYEYNIRKGRHIRSLEELNAKMPRIINESRLLTRKTGSNEGSGMPVNYHTGFDKRAVQPGTSGQTVPSRPLLVTMILFHGLFAVLFFW